VTDGEQNPLVHPSHGWWVGAELNHHSLSGAFTAPWARQCPAYPSQDSGISHQQSEPRGLLITDH